MIGLDTSYLAKHKINANDIAGLVPLSDIPLPISPFEKKMGIEGTPPIVDKYAPLFHVRKNAPRLLLITGNR